MSCEKTARGARRKGGMEVAGSGDMGRVPEKFSFEKGCFKGTHLVTNACMQNLAAISSLMHACKISPQSRLGVVAFVCEIFDEFYMNLYEFYMNLHEFYRNLYEFYRNLHKFHASSLPFFSKKFTIFTANL